jgi:hypothetical protein
VKSKEHCRMLASQVAAVLCGALIGWSCGGGSSSGSSTISFGSSASGGGPGSGGGGVGEFVEDGGAPVATLCGDPVCPTLPGEDASADGSMADGAGGSDSAPSDAAVSDGDGSSDAAASGDAPRD